MCLYRLINQEYKHRSSPGGSCKNKPVSFNHGEPWRSHQLFLRSPGFGASRDTGTKTFRMEICEQRKLFFLGGKVGQNTLKETSKVASGVIFIEAVVGCKVRKYCCFITWLNNTQLLNYYIHDFSVFHHFDNRLLNGRDIKNGDIYVPNAPCIEYVLTYTYIYLKKKTKEGNLAKYSVHGTFGCM